MALADRVTQPLPSVVHGLPCSIGALLTTLDNEESKALATMLYELNWNATQVYDALRDEGYAVGRQSINRHRAGKCRCSRDES